jgi:cysteine desulfurase/selenocysteine lyase
VDASLTNLRVEKPTYEVDAIRANFPILATQVNGYPLTFLDSGASAQKPECVLQAMDELYRKSYANVHRGAYALSQAATDHYEGARITVARYLNAKSEDEVVFTRNGTAAINLVASSYGKKNFSDGDEVIISQMEHHANIVPWQLLRDDIGIELKIATIDKNGEFQLDKFADMLGKKTKLVALTHVSNVLGTILPIKKIIELAHAKDIPVLIDGAQGIVHCRVDVQDLDVDFYAFTGHKLYGPSGIGVLYGKKELLNNMPPYQGGGDMIERVTFEISTYRDAPARFEAGTPPIVEAAGLAKAIEYVDAIGVENIAAHEQTLLAYATEQLSQIDGLEIYGRAQDKAGIISFTLDNVHPHDISTIIDSRGVAVRAGHHCAQPLMDWYGIAATTRASFGMYNNKNDVDAFINSLRYVKEIFC